MAKDKNREIMQKVKSENAYAVMREIEYKSKNQNSNYKRLSSSQLADKDEMIALGEAYYNQGLSVEDFPEEIKKNHFFMVGYEIGKRKALAQEIKKRSSR